MAALNVPSRQYGADTASSLESDTKIRNHACETEALLSGLYDSITRLEKRLDTVLTPTGPSKGSEATQAGIPQSQSHLTSRLRDINMQIMSDVNYINDIIQRIEV